MRTFKRPNVLLLYTDQQRWDSLGCYGNKLAVTPNLDRLAESGARLEYYFVQNPVCSPSRMSFLTGKYCGALGIGRNGIPFPEGEMAIHNFLKPYGYHTAQIGKLHFLPHAEREHRNPHPAYGFDTFILSDEPGCYDDAYIKWVESIAPDQVEKVRVSLPPAAFKRGKRSYSDVPRNTHEPYLFEGDEDLTHSAFVAAETCNFIEKHKEEPFFAISGFYAPHAPLNPPARFVDMYKDVELPLPRLGDNETVMPQLANVTPEKWRQTVRYYLALVSHVDHCVGRILEALEKAGILDDTIIIFTTDHGEYLGDHGRVQKGMPGHDCIARVPFLINYPGKIKPGMVISELVEGVDFVPTILDYCGIQTPSFVQGKSIKALLDGNEYSHKEDVFIEYFREDGKGRSATVRTRDYKYHCSSEGNEILYDLKKDPDELSNVIDEASYGPVLSDMRKRMIRKLQQTAFARNNLEAEY